MTRGIDVSYANGRIDWEKMKTNIDFVILRCGYGSNFANQDDARWYENVRECENNSIPYGVYLYSYATTPEKAKSEAKHALRLLQGHKPEYPVFLDLEESRISSLGKDRILEIAKVFCDAITSAGYLYGTYANKHWFANYLTDKWYDNYPKWIAQYNSECTYKGTYDIWQYSSTGTFDGFSGKFDLNYCYTSYLKGDVNADGRITAADARESLRISAKLREYSENEKYIADVNSDGKVTAADAGKILRESAGLE